MAILIPESELAFTFARSSGAGGQNINKVNSKVIMTWDMPRSYHCREDVKERFATRFTQYILDSGQVQIISQRYRTQQANRQDCIDKLYELLAQVEFPPKKRKATRPTRSSVQKRLTSKRKDSDKKRSRSGRFD